MEYIFLDCQGVHDANVSSFILKMDSEEYNCTDELVVIKWIRGTCIQKQLDAKTIQYSFSILGLGIQNEC